MTELASGGKSEAAGVVEAGAAGVANGLSAAAVLVVGVT